MNRTSSDERRTLLIQIHVAKRQLNLSDEEYRNLIKDSVGAESCQALSLLELKSVKEALVRAGYKPERLSPRSRDKEQKTATDKIRALWIELYRQGKSRAKSETALNRWVQGMFGVSRVEWLSKQQNRIAIEALKKWLQR